MAKMSCQCGECLSNSIVPNDIEWLIYTKEDFNHWIESDYFEYTEKHENFDGFWLCPKCKRAYVDLKIGKKHEERRTYEYRKINDKNIDVNISLMKELFLISSNDEDNFGDGILIKDLMTLYQHEHRYFITNDEKTLYLYNVNKEMIDGKYIMTYFSTDKYDFIPRENTIKIVKTYEGVEKYFDENGNEIIKEDKNGNSCRRNRKKGSIT